MAFFSSGILEVLLRVLDGYRGGHWVPQRVLQQTLNYLNQAVLHSHTWKILKPHMPAIIQDVLFPLMSYSTEDHELWTVDPHEYIRVKFGKSIISILIWFLVQRNFYFY